MRGELRVYLGAAPGVGKTFAMLQEGRRRQSRGADVVVGLVETHGRADTEQLLDELEVAPRRERSYRGAVFTELDTAAVLARRPQVALIDELAHTNVPESRNARRWQDVQELLDAGIHVITTINIQHLESAHAAVEQITGVPQRETVPDEVVRRAEVQLVDMAPEALRRRMVRGNVLPGEGVDTALSSYFRVGNLTALREIALIWLADKVGDQLDENHPDHEIAAALETRQRIVVALSGGAEGDTLLRRAAGFAARTKNADLVAVHVTRSDGLAGTGPDHLARQRDLVESMGGSYHQVLGDDVPTALLEFSRGVDATQLVLGASRRGRLARLSSPGVSAATAARSASIDVHLVAHEYAALGRRRSRPPDSGVSARRRLLGFAVMAAGLPLLTLLLANLRTDLQLPSDLVLFLAAVVGIALIGGLYPAVAAALAGALLLNYFFTPPLYELAIASSGDVVALTVVVAVAVAVSVVVDRAARRSREAAVAAAETETLSVLAGSVLRGDELLAGLLDQVRETFAMTSVALLERIDTGPTTPHTGRDPAKWRVAAAAGEDPCPAPEHGDAAIPVDDDLVLVLSGGPLAGRDRRVLETAAVQAGLAFRQQRLASQAEHAVLLGEADRMRRALLSAVSHDLRTPLASATAAVDSLAGQIIWTPEQRSELFATAQESLAGLRVLVENLLDMSSLQADALGVALRPIALDEAVPRALDHVAAARIGLDIPATLPEVNADPALLERILVNLLGNAVRHSPPNTPPHLTGSAQSDRVELRIIDHGPGIPAVDRDAAFRPFQRLGDSDNTNGIGLGLALSRELTKAMGGTLTAEDTPGGGLTMLLTLPAAARREQPPDMPTGQGDRPGGERPGYMP